MWLKEEIWLSAFALQNHDKSDALSILWINVYFIFLKYQFVCSEIILQKIRCEEDLIFFKKKIP